MAGERADSPDPAGMERVFLGWERAVVPMAAAWLWDRFGDGAGGGLGRMTVVVPGARAGRLLEVGLLEEAEKRGSALTPPAIVTPGEVASVAAEVLEGAHSWTPAGPMARRLAWRAALAALSREERQVLAPARKGDDGVEWTAPLAPLVEGLHDELVGEDLLFAEVPEAAAAMPVVREDRRWGVLAKLQREYARVLGEVGLADDGLECLRVIRGGDGGEDARGDGRGGRVGAEIVLAGVAELPRLARRGLRAVVQRGGVCTALIAAPAARADDFDAVGCVASARWAGARVDVADEAISVCDGPAEQAARVFEVLEEVGGDRGVGGAAAHEVAVGVPDAAVAFALRRGEERGGSVRFHDAAGRAFDVTRVGRLLSLIGELATERSLGALRELVSHPDIERWLERNDGEGTGGGVVAALARRVVHDYMCERFEERCDAVVQRAGGGDSRVEREVRELIQRIGGLLGPVAGAGPAPLTTIAAALQDALRAVFDGVMVDGQRPEGRALLASLWHARDAVIEMGALPEGLDGVVAPGAAVRLVLDRLESVSIPDEPADDAVELLGWLELLFDPADRLIVTGFNDNAIPANSKPDPFLPDSLRKLLGVACDERRYARDAYVLSALSARARRLELIVGRRSAEGDPLKPSRLLFATDDATAVARMARFAAEDGGAARRSVVAPTVPPRAVTGFAAMPRVAAEPVTGMSVTSFRRYLESPYAFYLMHVLGLREESEPGAELDPLGFGSLLHDVLRDFGRGEAAASTDAREIAAWLGAQLDVTVRAWYGDDPAAAVALQTRVMRRRLGAFAVEQAKRAAAGWRIIETEWSPADAVGVPWVVDGEPFWLRGRIDRVDRHESGRIALLDYKTGENASDPESAHHTKSGEWFDLQLPLYRRLAQELGVSAEGEDAPMLGYVTLAKAAGETKFRDAAWDAEALAGADAVAQGVIRSVRAGDFWRLGDNPPGEGLFAAICGTSYLGGSLVESGETGEGA